MCNNYGYVIMLSAAHDIIKSLDSNSNVSVDSFNNFLYTDWFTNSESSISNLQFQISAETEIKQPGNGTVRPCQPLSVGAILLADIIPALAINLLSSFLPFYMKWVT